MKIQTTIDKEYVTVARAKEVRETIAKFAKSATPRDLVTWFDNEFGHEYRSCGYYFAADEIIKATVCGICSNYSTAARVDVVLQGCDRFTALYYWVDLDPDGCITEISHGDMLHDLTVYRPV